MPAASATPTFRPSTPFSVFIPVSQPQTPAPPSSPTDTKETTEDKQAAREYLEETLPSTNEVNEKKEEISFQTNVVSTDVKKQESSFQVQSSSEQIVQQSSVQQRQSFVPLNETPKPFLGSNTAPAPVVKPQSVPAQTGGFPFTDADIFKPQMQVTSFKQSSSEQSSSIKQQTSIQYSNVVKQTESYSQESSSQYETLPIKSLIQTFEQGSMPPMKYKQMQKEGADIVKKNIPPPQKRPAPAPAPVQTPVVNGNVYYVASAHVETREFAPPPAPVTLKTTQQVTGYETSETQFQKFSSFSSSEQQKSITKSFSQQQEYSSIQNIQPTSLQFSASAAAANQQELLTKITGKMANFLSSFIPLF